MSIDQTGYVRPVGPAPSREQALLIALLAAGHPSLQAVDRKRPGFLAVHIDIPTGRVSWPIAPSDADLFEHVPFDNFATGDRLTRAERASRLEHALRGAGDDDLLIAQHREAHHFGSPPRFDIRMVPLFGLDRADYPGTLIPVTTSDQSDAAYQIGLQFKRELHYDFAPYDAEHDTALLIASRKFNATFPIVAGAVGMTAVDETTWTLDWIWIHPYERGTGLLAQAWRELADRFGQFRVTAPYSPAMIAAMRNLNVDPGRLANGGDPRQ